MFSIICNVRGLGLFHESFRLKICAAWFFVGAIVSVQAQPEHALGSWQLSSSWQNYSESQMNFKGPELGVHWQSQRFGLYSFEADAHLGVQNYSSVQSGRLNSVLSLDTRWRALRAFKAQPQLHYGLALHTHANFFRGTTSLGFGGYDRLSTQVWLPVRWHSASSRPWTVHAGWLLWGEHLSRLSQANTSLQDVTNQQRKGAYLQISKKVNTDLGEMEPYARWAWVDRSDVMKVNMASLSTVSYEPENTRLQMGMKWHFR
jgi:hypothetical protein